jgi:hypothetical protein
MLRLCVSATSTVVRAVYSRRIFKIARVWVCAPHDCSSCKVQARVHRDWIFNTQVPRPAVQKNPSVLLFHTLETNLWMFLLQCFQCGEVLLPANMVWFLLGVVQLKLPYETPRQCAWRRTLTFSMTSGVSEIGLM